MTFSFISPNRKVFFSAITQSWAACFIASTFVVVIIWFLLDWQIERFLQHSKQIQQKITKEQSYQHDLNQRLSFLQSQIQKLQEAKQQNTSLTNAVQNLFDLIPEQITINSISLTDQSLIIKGITPSKELYTFLLDPSLKAVFSQSRVDFFVLPSGWYNFVSVNKITSNQKDRS